MGGKEQPMISCEVLEKPGWWREISLVTIIVLSLGPALPLLWVALTETSSPLTGGFGLAVWRSFVVATAVTLISLLAGIPAGLLSGLYDFPGRINATLSAEKACVAAHNQRSIDSVIPVRALTIHLIVSASHCRL